MADKREMTCIVCPNGCQLAVTVSTEGQPEVRGALCKKGEEYARAELLNPVRTLTTTVRVSGGELPLVSVRTARPVPKAVMREAAKVLSHVEVAAPIALHQMVVRNLLGTGIEVLATREIRSRKVGK
jgi:CxxC motif-containing protein